MKPKTFYARLTGFLSVSGLLFILSLFTGCDENASTFGNNILPEEDNAMVRVFNGSIIDFYTENPGDSILSDDGYMRSLGHHYDQVFGSTKADILVDVIPRKKHLGTNVKADSLVLYIPLDSLYGKKNELLNIRLYRLNKMLDDTLRYDSKTDPSPYYSDSDILAETKFNTSDTVIAIRIYNVGLVNSLATMDSSEMDVTKFRNVFKGFFVHIEKDPTATEGAIVYPNVLATNLRLHYTSDDGEFQNLFCYVRNMISCYEINKTGAVIEPYMDLNQPSTDMAFVQGMGGADMVFELRDALRWRDSLENQGISIVKAELLLKPKDMSGYGLLTSQYPKRLMLLYYDNEGKEHTVSQSPTKGGYSVEKNEYIFNLNLHYMRYLKGTIDYTRFKVVPVYQEDDYTGLDILNRIYDARRVVIDPSASRLQIYYTKPY